MGTSQIDGVVEAGSADGAAQVFVKFFVLLEGDGVVANRSLPKEGEYFRRIIFEKAFLLF